MRRPAIRSLLVVMLLLAAHSVTRAQQQVEAKITYISGTTVYVDAGSDQGLAVGSILEVVRAGAVVARLRVDTVTAKRASATPEGEMPPLAPGEIVRFAPVAPAAAPAAAPSASTAQPAEQRARGGSGGLHGRIGARWLAVRDRSGIGQDFTQPALDLRLGGSEIGGTPFDFNVDLRPRRTYRTHADGTTEEFGSHRLYSLMGAWNGGPVRIAAGRQANPSLGPVSLFDGVLAEYRTGRVAAGLFAGTEPDPTDYTFDDVTRDYGVYAQGTSAPAAKTRWWVYGGYLASTTDGEINRDTGYVSGRLQRGGFSGYLYQQVDVNRGWRKTAEGTSVTWSGSYLSLRYRWTSGFSVQGGLDNRRNVLVYRDFVTPQTNFDDEYRQGYWGGLEWRPQRWLVGIEARSSSSDSAGSAEAYTLSLGALGMTSVGLDVRLRATHYTGPWVEGDLAALSVSLDLGSHVRLDVHGEGRDETILTMFDESTRVTSIGAGLEAQAGRRTFVTAAYDRTSGGDEDNDQLYTGLTFRF